MINLMKNCTKNDLFIFAVQIVRTGPDYQMCTLPVIYYILYTIIT